MKLLKRKFHIFPVLFNSFELTCIPTSSSLRELFPFMSSDVFRVYYFSTLLQILLKFLLSFFCRAPIVPQLIVGKDEIPNCSGELINIYQLFSATLCKLHQKNFRTVNKVEEYGVRNKVEEYDCLC